MFNFKKGQLIEVEKECLVAQLDVLMSEEYKVKVEYQMGYYQNRESLEFIRVIAKFLKITPIVYLVGTAWV